MALERPDSAGRPELPKQEMSLGILPMVLSIMKLQSHPIRSTLLIALREQQEGMSSRQLRRALKKPRGGKDVSGSTMLHITLELEKECLVARKDWKLYVLTQLGSAAVEAFNKYQSNLVEPLHAARIERITRERGAEAAKVFAVELSKVSVEESPWAIPAVLRILGVQSNPLQLAVLRSLNRNRDEAIPYRELRQMVSGFPDVIKVPASTLSHALSKMEKEDLVRRQLHGALTLTSLGLKSMEALVNYISLSEKPGIGTLLLERDLNDVLSPQGSGV